jgi:mono/diheme cytochrome c family protein
MRGMPITVVMLCAIATGGGCKATASRSGAAEAPMAHPMTEAESPGALLPVSSFTSQATSAERSVALFTEAGRVLTHPRCSNCHPADGIPRQGLEQQPHVPGVLGGTEGHGPPGLPCVSCHRETNMPLVGATLRSVPGNPKWALAPAEMAWVGRSLGEICEQLKDPKRNGGKSLAELQHHMAEDVLVGWAWDPGPGRQPVPGTQQAFGELIQAWIDTGARCPKP